MPDSDLVIEPALRVVRSHAQNARMLDLCSPRSGAMPLQQENFTRCVGSIFLSVDVRCSQVAETLSDGEQQMLAMAHTLMGEPS